MLDISEDFSSRTMSPESTSMGSIVDPSLLDKIDKLFACGVGEYIPLPQLVVVGDQSSGKSSVLEAITNLPFPRDSGLCTRFATQITFRRAAATSTTVSIIPSKNAPQSHLERVRVWKRHANKDLEPKAFAEIMKEVHLLMGLGDQDSGECRTFSEDVLKLEVCGPQCQHLSVIDVPGIFRTATKGITTLADAQMVKSMVKGYMHNPRSTMLTVIPANVDIATQEILTMAEEADPDGYRTLGVLTKPDLVDSGAEPAVVQLLQGEKHPLNLGWCLVRNLGQQQAQENPTSRASTEKAFFRDRAPWNTLDKDRVGVEALRSRLQEILASNIRREFPHVKRDIQTKLSTARRGLEHLGKKRETSEEQRRFILEMSMRFQDVVNMALNSSYSGSPWFDETPSLMFVTSVVNRNETFAESLERYGHSYAFNASTSSAGQEVLTEGSKKRKAASSSSSDSSSDEDGDYRDAHVAKKSKHAHKSSSPVSSHSSSSDSDSSSDIADESVALRLTEDHDDLMDLVSGDTYIDSNIGHDIIAWLTDLHRSSRGFELGTFDKNLLAKTMKAQSAKWEPLALGYIFDVIHMAHVFIRDLLRHVCPDGRVREGIMSVLMDPLLQRYRAAVEHASFLSNVERTNPQTTNHYFNDNLQKSRQQRIRASLQEHAFEVKRTARTAVYLDQIVDNHPMSNATHTVFELHDILKSYYKVARKRFVDNICMQAADFHLMTGPNNPLKMFSPEFVSSLSVDQLEEIAGEDVALKRKRAALAKEVADLERGRKIIG